VPDVLAAWVDAGGELIDDPVGVEDLALVVDLAVAVILSAASPSMAGVWTSACIDSALYSFAQCAVDFHA